MATENTIEAILSAGKIQQDANNSLRNSVLYAFSQVGDALGFKHKIYNDIIGAELDYKKLAIDEEYKSRTLKLQEQNLELERGYKRDYLDLRKAELQAKKEEQEKSDARKRLDIVAYKQSVLIGNENKNIEASIKELERRINGGAVIDKNGDTIPGTFTAPLIVGSTEYTSSKSTLEKLKERLDLNNDRLRKLQDAGIRATLGEDIGSIALDLGVNIEPLEKEPSIPVTPESPPKKPSPEDIESGTGLNLPLPKKTNNGGVLESLTPNARIRGGKTTDIFETKQPLTKDPKADIWSIDKNITKQPLYYSKEQYFTYIKSARQSIKNDEQFPQHIVDKMYEGLSPEDKKIIDESKREIKKSYYLSVGRATINGGQEYSDIDKNLEYIKRRYKELGGNTSDLDEVRSKVETDISKSINTKEYKDNNNETEKQKSFLLDGIFKSAEEFEKTKEPEKPFIGRKDVTLFAPDAKIKKDGSIVETKDSNDASKEGLITRFNNAFFESSGNFEFGGITQKGIAKDSIDKFQSNFAAYLSKFKNWKDFFDEDFITVPGFAKTIIPGAYMDNYYEPERTVVDNEKANAAMEKEKIKLLQDPKRAFAFWAFKERLQQVKNLGKNLK